LDLDSTIPVDPKKAKITHKKEKSENLLCYLTALKALKSSIDSKKKQTALFEHLKTALKFHRFWS
jgi:hypothetical protein